MKKTKLGRVSFTSLANFLVGNTNRHSMHARRAGAVNYLEAILRDGMKQTLKRVVEVQYTTPMLEVSG